MPIAGDSKLISGMSPALKRRMQGKACFNFTVVDAAAVHERRGITKRAYQNWKSIGRLD